MKVAIHNGDGNVTRFPNLALMKISSCHKAQGDSVEWFSPLVNYDVVYSSKVFTFTKRDPYLPAGAILGGTGYDVKSQLDSIMEVCEPDYTIYPDFPHKLGFITRGCPRCCEWCIVPLKEGRIHGASKFKDIVKNTTGASAVLMDNNFLAYKYHERELENIIKLNARIDFNQGLDARLVTKRNAPLLARVSWIKYIRFSCDTIQMRGVVQQAVELIRSYGHKGIPFCCVLVRDVSEAHETCEFLRQIKIDPFAQAYMDYSGKDKRTMEQKRFCRWVNHKAIFNAIEWKNYKTGRGQREWTDLTTGRATEISFDGHNHQGMLNL